MGSPQSILLIGYRGTGKTSVARELAARLGSTWIDLDHFIQERQQKSIREIFESEGESQFRTYESRALEEICAQPGRIISLGGGVVLSAGNREIIQNNGVVFWLDASSGVIHERLLQDESTIEQRPALTNQGGLAEIEQMLNERRPLYAECAHHRVDTDGGTVTEVVQMVLDKLAGTED